RLLAFADPDTLRAAAAALNLPLQLLPEDAEARVPGDLRVRVVANTVPSHFGQANPANAGAVIGALLGAGQACLSGELHGVVTGPVHKAVINEGSIAYSGTTELLADQAGVKVVMMLANHIVRVALATT
ncbi:4-hydroxythreonine-4-phosphate dehydrogenase PdxA, partial [Enterobacter hormaechei]|uniref:4-hydroxythreonine-4-phosphate dehydrogenase PdxA n=1 Tax=Enterobacter hormaechei TaxID=158836 RepID=UPI0019531C4C